MNCQFEAALERLMNLQPNVSETSARQQTSADVQKFDFRYNTFGESPQGRAKAQEGQLITDANPAMALHHAENFIADMAADTEPRWLTLAGMNGTGKTHLGKMILRFFNHKLFSRGYGGLMPWVRMLGYLRDKQHGILQNVINDYFVVVDDIGAAHETEFGDAKLYELLEGRLNKWTVITCNGLLKQLAEKDRRIPSRMIRGGNVVVELNALDYNLRNATTSPR